MDNFKDAKPVSKTQKSLTKITDEVVTEGKEFRNSKLSADDLTSVSEDQIKTKIGELMGSIMDPNTGEDLPDLKMKVQKKAASLRRRKM